MSKKLNNNDDINRSINSNSNNAITDRLLSSMSVSSRERPRLKLTKSMDIESHCTEVYGCGSDEDDYDYKNENNNNKSSNNNNNSNNIDNSYHQLNKNGGYGYGHDFDSDDDSFAEADSDCEPDQNYLDEMLEEIHPEHINLFEYKKKEQQQYCDYDQVCAQDQYNENHVDVDVDFDDENENDYIVNNGKSSTIGRLDVDVNNNVDNGHENNSSINRKYRTKTKEEDSEDEKEDDAFDSSSTNSKEKRR